MDYWSITATVLNTTLFSILGLIHVYWALGGKWALQNSLPTTADGVRVLHPSLMGTLAVAVFLFVLAFCTVYQGAVSKFVFLGISSIFLLRAIGDFKYVGLFKQVRCTAFAQKDTRYFIPLCICIALNALIVFF